ncbi:hypothetical protein A2U01_0065146, partial [Trifolium medium]|nr:hypothetical protein [Trifolium medium]
MVSSSFSSLMISTLSRRRIYIGSLVSFAIANVSRSIGLFKIWGNQIVFT